MGTLLARLKGRAAVAALAVMGCNAPDASALFRPIGPASTPSEARGEGSPAPDSRAGLSPDSGVAAAPNGDGTLQPGTGVAPDDGQALPLEPPIPTVPIDAGAVTPGAVTPPPAAPAPAEPAPAEPEPATPSAVTPDAGSEATPMEPVDPPCAGALVGGLCWYLSELNQSCETVCATHGGFEPASVASIGTPLQGGSIEACAAILAVLGQAPLLVTEGFREDGLGFGCHLFVDVNGETSAWWLTAPAFSPSVSDPSARVACACTR